MEIIREKGLVKEMADNNKGFKIEVPFADGVNVKELTKGDKNPLFVTVEALNPTKSKNGRIWSESIIQDVASQINNKRPDAYQGHIKAEDQGFITPTSKTIWLGASIKNIAGKTRLFIKGYVLPYAKQLRQYLRAAKAAGKRVGVSVCGEALQKWNSVKQGYDIEQFNLESIDWTRSGAEGVPGMGYLGLASEMKKGENPMDKKEILEKTTISEMKEYNPELVKTFKDKVRKSVVTEMEDKITKANEKTEQFANAIPESLERKPETITEMFNSHQALMSDYVDNQLKSRVETQSVRNVIRKEVISEMAGQFMTKELVDSSIDKVMKTDEIKSIVTEMNNLTTINPGEDNREESQEKQYKYLQN
jgi:hypothetical protein